MTRRGESEDRERASLRLSARRASSSSSRLDARSTALDARALALQLKAHLHRGRLPSLASPAGRLVAPCRPHLARHLSVELASHGRPLEQRWTRCAAAVHAPCSSDPESRPRSPRSAFLALVLSLLASCGRCNRTACVAISHGASRPLGERLCGLVRLVTAPNRSFADKQHNNLAPAPTPLHGPPASSSTLS